MSDVEKNLKPEVIVFAGPNGSGKSTITKMAKTVGVYINADDIKRSLNLLRRAKENGYFIRCIYCWYYITLSFICQSTYIIF